MKVIFTIQHPAHVHLFRNAIQILSSEGHDVHTFARKKEINLDLLNSYNIDYEVLALEPSSSLQLPFVQLKYEWEIIKAARQLDPDVLVAMGEPSITHAAKITNAKSLIFTDTEQATLQNILAFPFADRIYTPECYQDNIGKKQVRYPGYHELAYLHPNRFTPDPSIMKEADLNEDERFVILRSVAWNAMHDIGDSGIKDITEVVQELEELGVRVLITSEEPLPERVEHCRIAVKTHQIHHLMYYADLYIGESATMATESAVLGTPSLFISSSRRGYTDELEEEYGLVFNYSGEKRHEEGLQKAISILEKNDSDRWERRRRHMLEERTDTTKIITSAVKEHDQ